MRASIIALWTVLSLVAGTVGCGGDVGDIDVPTSEEILFQYPDQCKPACDAGYSRFYKYCQNQAHVPATLKQKCESFADNSHKECIQSEVNYQCDTACTNLVVTFENFCREYTHKGVKKCWENTSPAFGECKKAAPRR